MWALWSTLQFGNNLEYTPECRLWLVDNLISSGAELLIATGYQSLAARTSKRKGRLCIVIVEAVNLAQKRIGTGHAMCGLEHNMSRLIQALCFKHRVKRSLELKALWCVCQAV
jgi:hypothetical protein